MVINKIHRHLIWHFKILKLCQVDYLKKNLKSLEVWEKTFREQELSGTVSDLQAFKASFP